MVPTACTGNIIAVIAISVLYPYEKRVCVNYSLLSTTRVTPLSYVRHTTHSGLVWVVRMGASWCGSQWKLQRAAAVSMEAHAATPPRATLTRFRSITNICGTTDRPIDPPLPVCIKSRPQDSQQPITARSDFHASFSRDFGLGSHVLKQSKGLLHGPKSSRLECCSCIINLIPSRLLGTDEQCICVCLN